MSRSGRPQIAAIAGDQAQARAESPARGRTQAEALNKSKLVFISINVNYEYSGKFDWGRKPRAPARVQHVLDVVTHVPSARFHRLVEKRNEFHLWGAWAMSRWLRLAAMHSA